ncbi:MAG: acyltransferase [Halobacteriota archaeon]
MRVNCNVRRLTEYPSDGRNSMWGWAKIKNPLRIALNYVVIRICGLIPSLSIKNTLYRSIGMKIGKDVSVGLEVTFDIFFPELIEIADNSVIGFRATVLCHEFLVDTWKVGAVKIGKNVLVGANSTILAGVTIGDGARVSACSLANHDIASGVLVGGVPARELRSE